MASAAAWFGVGVALFGVSVALFQDPLRRFVWGPKLTVTPK